MPPSLKKIKSWALEENIPPATKKTAAKPPNNTFLPMSNPPKLSISMIEHILNVFLLLVNLSDNILLSKGK
jgi:hypothetical protein